MSQQWWVFANDKQHGPFTAGQLRQLADQGKISPETLIIADGMQTPVAANRVSRLFNAPSELEAAPPSTQVRKPPIINPRGPAVVEQRRPPVVAQQRKPNSVIMVAAAAEQTTTKRLTVNPMMLAAWSLVGLAAVAAIGFMSWHSSSRHQAKVAAADGSVSKAIADANRWIGGDSSFEVAHIEQSLNEAIRDPLTTKRANGEAALTQVQRHREQLAERLRIEAADQVFVQAKQQIAAKQVAEAIVLLRQYIIDPRGSDRAAARQLLDEAETAISESATQAAITAMTDDQLAAAILAREIPDGKVTNLALKAIRADIIDRLSAVEYQRRNDLKVAAEKRAEAERLAAIEQKRAAEELKREAEDLKRLQAERAQAEKLAAARAAAQAAARQQAAEEEAINAMIEEHNDLVKASMIRWAGTLGPRDRVKFVEPMKTVVWCSKAVEQFNKAELIESFQNILERSDLREMEEFIDRSGIGELIVKVKADGKTRKFDEAWTYGISLVIKEGKKGQ